MNVGDKIQVRPGEWVTCIQSSADGGVFIFDMEMPPRSSGPPMHTHDEGDETVEVLSGTIEFKIRDRWHRLEAGQSLTLTPNDPHTFRNPSRSEPVRCRVSHGPRFERAMVQPDLTRIAMYLVGVDPGATRMVSPVVRATLWMFAKVGHLRGLRMA